ncbi:MAG: zinc metallopeptidase [Bacillota bacterium]|nr:zinc metallopeptidase [Bacillota bacterium]
MFFDWTFVILIPALIISFWAQMKIGSTFGKYSKVRSNKGYNGAQVARILLDSQGLQNVPVELIPGKLTDHYDPIHRVMRLSSDVFYGDSVASLGVAAHETGHAIQHKKMYSPLIIRNKIAPIASFSSNASWLIFLIGMLFGIGFFARIGVLLFGAVVVFQLITLPVEFDASRRALRILEDRSILYADEIAGAKAVLNAAAMTYVAAALMAVSQLLRLLLISREER